MNEPVFFEGDGLGLSLSCDPNHQTNISLGNWDWELECPGFPGLTDKSKVEETNASPINLITPPGSFDDHTTPEPAPPPAKARRISGSSSPSPGRTASKRKAPEHSRTKKTLRPQPADAGKHRASPTVEGHDSPANIITGGGTPPMEPPPETQDSRRRGRNRYAARKCRVKKHEENEKLAADAVSAESANALLRLEASGLRDETLLLRNLVLQHGGCDCDFIRAYIQNSASALVWDDGHLKSPPREKRMNPMESPKL